MVVPSVGFEPTRSSEHLILNQACLPVSPQGVVSPRLTLGDRADLSALFQREEEFFVLDISNDFIEELDVLVKNTSNDLRGGRQSSHFLADHATASCRA